jgi:chitinase
MITDEPTHTHGQLPPGGPSGPQPTELPDPPRRRLSPLRVLVFLAAVALVAFGGGHLLTTRSAQASAPGRAATVYQPYIDATLTPTYPFQSPTSDPVSDPVLGFVVTTAARPCTPTWGGYYTLAGAETALDLDARIAQLRAQGGSPTISFGGQDNSEPAVTCTSPSALRAAYLAPITRYHASEIDLDIEGASLADTASDTRRATAIAAVQRERAAAGHPLRVWVTLPVTNTGLTAADDAVVRTMLAAHVNLTGVNEMAMDFGPGEGARSDMFATVHDAVDAGHKQVMALYQAAGLSGSSAAAWQHLGVTVMIGVNDVSGERFTITDAHRLAHLAAADGIARVSAWSLNRDAACGGAFTMDGVVSNTCSGVTQRSLQFTRILSHLRGTTRAQAQSDLLAPSVTSAAPDNSADSPYPIWRSDAAYEAGFKVVWHHEIYEARWWTQDTPPDAVSSAAAADAWLLIGPVPAGSHGPQHRLLVRGRQATWSPTRVYQAGARVSFHGLPFAARWWTKGDRPSTNLPASDSSPWKPLYLDRGEPAATGA